MAWPFTIPYDLDYAVESLLTRGLYDLSSAFMTESAPTAWIPSDASLNSFAPDTLDSDLPSGVGEYHIMTKKLTTSERGNLRAEARSKARREKTLNKRSDAADNILKTIFDSSAVRSRS